MSKSSNRETVRALAAPNAEPNVIPFIDIMLVLLIIFMVSAPRPTTDIRVDMPNRSVARPELGAPTLVELRSVDGVARIYIDGEESAFNALGVNVFARVRVNNPSLEEGRMLSEGRVLVRADQSLAYGELVEAMDVIKREGFAHVGLFAEEAADQT